MFIVPIGVNLAHKFERRSMQKISISILLFVVCLVGVNITAFSQTAIISTPSSIPTSICSGDSIIFIADDNGGTLTSFQWNFNGGALGPQTIYGQTVTYIAGTPNGTPYNMSLTVSDGTNFNSLNFSITVNGCNPPTINISGSPTTLCAGTQATFTDATTPGSDPVLVNRLWTFPGGIPATSSLANTLVTYTTAGIYDVYYKTEDGNGIYRDTLTNYITVLACPNPVANFTANQSRICPSDCINFSDNSQNMVVGQSTWSWSFPGADSASSVQQNPVNVCYQIPGLYTVILTVTNFTGSDTKVRTNYIQVDSCTPPVPSFTVEKQEICQNTCVKFTNTSRRSDSVVWQFFGADPIYQFSSENEPVVCYSNEGKYDVQLMAINPYGAQPIQESEYMSIQKFPEVQAPADVTVLVGQSVSLQSYGSGDGFRWSPDDGSINCLYCSRAIVSPLENTKYYVTNITDNGCERSDSVNVIVVKNYYRGVPDAFSPNGDEENDVLQILGNGISDVEFYVYNRQGDIVFESRSQSVGWDGTYKGEPSAPGVYAYFAKVSYVSGFQEILKGDVTLVR
ncbi:MAG: gliding motility-associated-like protein [Salibacteraceae bacterium]